MLEIIQGTNYDKVYLNNNFIGYIYYHVGIANYVYEGIFTGTIEYQSSERDDVIEWLLRFSS